MQLNLSQSWRYLRDKELTAYTLKSLGYAFINILNIPGFDLKIKLQQLGTVYLCLKRISIYNISQKKSFYPYYIA